MKTSGFTLAEVLLTLAIIGVVAVLTIPAVITKVTQDQYVVGLKKAYNTLKSVQREAEQEHGPMENWNWTLDSEEFFEKYFKAYFDILKDCGENSDDDCFHGEDETEFLDGIVNGTNYNTTEYYNFITSDGIAYCFYVSGNPYPSYVGSFIVDVNGKKGPNTWGRDIFEFNIFRKVGIKPQGSLFSETGATPSSVVDNDCNTSTGSGSTCAAKVLSEGAMNY